MIRKLSHSLRISVDLIQGAAVDLNDYFKAELKEIAVKDYPNARPVDDFQIRVPIHNHSAPSSDWMVHLEISQSFDIGADQ